MEQASPTSASRRSYIAAVLLCTTEQSLLRIFACSLRVLKCCYCCCYCYQTLEVVSHRGIIVVRNAGCQTDGPSSILRGCSRLEPWTGADLPPPISSTCGTLLRGIENRSAFAINGGGFLHSPLLHRRNNGSDLSRHPFVFIRLAASLQWTMAGRQQPGGGTGKASELLSSKNVHLHPPCLHAHPYIHE